MTTRTKSPTATRATTTTYHYGNNLIVSAPAPCRTSTLSATGRPRGRSLQRVERCCGGMPEVTPGWSFKRQKRRTLTWLMEKKDGTKDKSFQKLKLELIRREIDEHSLWFTKSFIIQSQTSTMYHWISSDLMIYCRWSASKYLKSWSTCHRFIKVSCKGLCRGPGTEIISWHLVLVRQMFQSNINLMHHNKDKRIK